VVPLEPIEKIKLTQKALLKQQEELVKILKTKHKDAYDWMKESNIDPLNLKAHSASLAAAMVLAVAATAPTKEVPQLTPQVKQIEVSELRGKSEEQKAELVWKRYGFTIRRAATKYNIDPKVIFATIMLESGGDTYAIRHEPQIGDASYGLGQILYGTAMGIGFEGNPQDLFDPEVNIELIARYHRRNLDVYGELTPHQLTIAYNAGSPYSSPHPGHINKFQKWFNQVEKFTG